MTDQNLNYAQILAAIQNDPKSYNTGPLGMENFSNLAGKMPNFGQLPVSEIVQLLNALKPPILSPMSGGEANDREAKPRGDWNLLAPWAPQKSGEEAF